jgi:hypothetical protein
VITHELVHVVRFCKYLQRFDADPVERQVEEIRVHEITHKALGALGLSDLEYVLQAYRNYQFMEQLRDFTDE